MLAVSDCVCLLGRLRGRRGCWELQSGRGQQVLSGGLPAQATRNTFLPTLGCSLSSSPSWLRVHHHPWWPPPWALCPSCGVEGLGNGKRSDSPSEIKSKQYLPFRMFSKEYCFKALVVVGGGDGLLRGDGKALCLYRGAVSMGRGRLPERVLKMCVLHCVCVTLQ